MPHLLLSTTRSRNLYAALLTAGLLGGCQLGVHPETRPVMLAEPEQPTARCECPEPEPTPVLVCPPPAPAPKPRACPPVNQLGNKILLGAVEFVHLESPDLKMRARIDSGAETSSLHAIGIELFERDGERWVRFQTMAEEGDAAVDMELPLSRKARIKSKTSADDIDKRPVVELNLRLGQRTERVEVSLVDRGHFTYPVLIGRNFLQDAALIDVSREYVQGE